METEKWSEWKLDKAQLAYSLMGAIMAYLIFPMIPYLIMRDLKMPVEANTFFTVFVYLFCLRVFRILNHPPRYRTLLQEKGDT